MNPEDAYKARIKKALERWVPPYDGNGSPITPIDGRTHCYRIKMRTQSDANMREHWAVKAKRAKTQRALVWAAMNRSRATLEGLRKAAGWSVLLTRVAPRPLDAHDNLRGALKATADQVTSCLGLDSDRDERIRFEYGQKSAGVREYAVEITVTPR